MSSAAAQRRAWNEAMRNAGAAIPSATSSTIGSNASAAHPLGGGGIRASDRRRKASRRDRARKSSIYGGTAGEDGGVGNSSSQLLEEREYRVAMHMDMLEGVNDMAISMEDNDDEEYDEFAELDEDDEEVTKSKSKKKRRRKPASASGGGSNAATLPKYLKPRSLASILIEEASRSDSVAKQYVDAAVRPLRKNTKRSEQVSNSTVNDATVIRMTKPYPPRKFCPVTGLFGEYTEPKSGIPYATLPALEQIRERAPPWMMQNSAGSASYWEAIRSLQNDE